MADKRLHEGKNLVDATRWAGDGVADMQHPEYHPKSLPSHDGGKRKGPGQSKLCFSSPGF